MSADMANIYGFLDRTVFLVTHLILSDLYIGRSFWSSQHELGNVVVIISVPDEVSFELFDVDGDDPTNTNNDTEVDGVVKVDNDKINHSVEVSNNIKLEGKMVGGGCTHLLQLISSVISKN